MVCSFGLLTVHTGETDEHSPKSIGGNTNRISLDRDSVDLGHSPRHKNREEKRRRQIIYDRSNRPLLRIAPARKRIPQFEHVPANPRRSLDAFARDGLRLRPHRRHWPAPDRLPKSEKG